MPRIYKKKESSRTGHVDEASMESAIKEVINKTLSIRKSAAKYGIKPSTLESRLAKIKKLTNEAPPRCFASKYTSKQVFTTAEETLLNKYITECSRMNYGLTLIQLRRLAYEFAKVNHLQFPSSWDQNGMAGLDWAKSYRHRNINLSLRKPENTSAARAYGFNKSAVNEFFNNLEAVLTRYNFTCDRIYNFDESGISTVMSTPKVLAEKCRKQVGQLVSGERGELVTFGGIISASGNTIPPLFIFPRVNFKDHFMAGAPEGSLGVATRSGWINSDIFIQVLKHIQNKTSCSKENPILLLVDNHESHVTVEAIDYARDNGIVYVSFPPHTTHRLQPLDVGVFGPFKAKLKVAFNDWHVSNPGKTLNIYHIPKLAKIAYFESFTNKNIMNAFEKTGIWPYNKLAFSDEDFAPIQVYQSNSSATININMQQQEPFIEENVIVEQSTPLNSPPSSPSLLQSMDIHAPSSPAPGLITPEAVRPYPKVNRDQSTRPKKGKISGKSRIYTDTPEKQRLLETQKVKEMKKQEQERKNRAKEMKRALKLIAQTDKKAKPKRQKKDAELETDSEDAANISLRDSCSSPISTEGSDFDEETNKEEPVLSQNINEETFVIVKFEKKSTVLHYVGKVLNKYGPMEYHVSFLRKKPGSWKFVFPHVKDEGTVFLSDIVAVLPPPKSASTARTANIFGFERNFIGYNVQ